MGRAVFEVAARDDFQAPALGKNGYVYETTPSKLRYAAILFLGSNEREDEYQIIACGGNAKQAARRAKRKGYPNCRVIRMTPEMRRMEQRVQFERLSRETPEARTTR